MDVLTKSQRSYCMSRIRGKNTKPETALALLLRPLGLRLRKHQNLVGRPDLANQRAKVAIFIDGCFWHKCPLHYSEPKSNSEFWKKKIQRNIERDRHVNKELRKEGFTVIRLWEHEIKNPEKALKKVTRKTKNLY